MKKDYFTLKSTLGKSDTFRIVDAAGKTVTSFTLDDDHKAVSVYIEQPHPGLERPIKFLERKAWHYFYSLFDILEEIEAINPDAGTDIFGKMFAAFDED